MARIFTITTPAETVRVAADGRASMVFTVTNVSGVPERALVRPVPLANTRAEWLAIDGQAEREFGAGGVQQFTVTASVPQGTPAGRYTYRLDAISARRAGEEREEGPVVALEVAPPEPPKKKSMAWLWILIAALLLIGAVVAWLLFGNREPKKPTDLKASVPRNGIALWLIADDARPLNGPNLDVWQNQEYAGVRATAMNIAAQPSIITNTLNGHAVVRFDGQDDMMQTNVEFKKDRMPAGATVFTVFTSATAESSPLRKVYGCDDGGYDPAAGLDSRAGDKNYGVFTGTGVAGYFALQANRPYLTTDQFSWTSFNGWVNGRATLVAEPTSHNENTLPVLYIGGTGPVFFEHWQGDIAEMLVYNRALNDAERRNVEDYLAAKYAITLNR